MCRCSTCVCSAGELPRNIRLGAYLVMLLLSYKWLPVVVLKKAKVAKCPVRLLSCKTHQAFFLCFAFARISLLRTS